MKITFAKPAGQVFKPRKPRRQQEEPLTPAQSARVQELFRDTKPKLNANRVVRQMVRDGGLFGGLFERQVKEAAECLGVNAATLNMDQKRILVHMSHQAVTDNERREMLAEAE